MAPLKNLGLIVNNTSITLSDAEKEMIESIYKKELVLPTVALIIGLVNILVSIYILTLYTERANIKKIWIEYLGLE